MSNAPTAFENARTDELLDELSLDMGVDLEMDEPPMVRQDTFPPRVMPTAAMPMESRQSAHELPPTPRSKVLPRLLAMADSYLRAGSLRQALEMYFDLARNHDETPEAIQAEERILEVARIHEENGEFHMARAIYEQMI